MIEKYKRNGFSVFFRRGLVCFRKKPHLCNPIQQGRSSAGLERFSHIEEVIGSNPIVPTF